MKKLLTIGTLCLACNGAGALEVINPGGGLITSCSTSSYQTCTSGTYASSCNTTACSSCKNGSQSAANSIGIITIKSAGTYYTNCSTSPHQCTCNGQITTYACADGFYGTPTSNLSGCTECPANATCAFGSNDTFKCNLKYLKTDNACIPCPTIGVYMCSGSTLVCSKNYYRDGNTCVPCPPSGGVYGTTATPTFSSGATSITDCYIPADTTMHGSDTSGSYEYYFIDKANNQGIDCYYTN